MPLTGQAKRDYQREWIRRRRDAWIESNGPCGSCGSTEDLQVDHVDPATKTLDPAGIWGLSEAKRLPELALCQVLCARCHKVKSDAEKARQPDHGTRARYSRHGGCRCTDCREANAVYEHRRRSGLAVGG